MVGGGGGSCRRKVILIGRIGAARRTDGSCREEKPWILLQGFYVQYSLLSRDFVPTVANTNATAENNNRLNDSIQEILISW